LRCVTVHLSARWREWFSVVVCSEDVQRKKPDPEVYARAVAALGLSPHQVLAIEDSPDGTAAASAAGVPVIVARSAYFADARARTCGAHASPGVR